jgi:hypothetical protein
MIPCRLVNVDGRKPLGHHVFPNDQSVPPKRLQPPIRIQDETTSTAATLDDVSLERIVLNNALSSQIKLYCLIRRTHRAVHLCAEVPRSSVI